MLQESPKQILYRLVKSANKMVIVKPGGTYPSKRVDIQITENYLIVYSHTKGNYYNVFGNHYKYFHDIKTGEFIKDDFVKVEKIIATERFLLSDYKKIEKIKSA